MSRFSQPVVLFAAAALALPAGAQTPVAPPAPPAPPMVAPPPVAPAKSPEQMTPEELRAWKKANGSYYVQCDGQPDNMGAGETAARLIALTAVIGLLAPPPEAADPAKRKFGTAGVAACSTLIDGAKMESSPSRRIGLILARGAHQIEAKDYPAAIRDAELARKAATDAGLSADPYWANSRGRGADLLEAAALYRMGKPVEASEVALRNQAASRYGLFQLLSVPQYYAFVPTAAPGEAAYQDARNHVWPWLATSSADRLEQLGKFAEAATLRDALVDLDATTPKTISSLAIAQAAVSHALAGHAERAAELAKAAQANFDRRRDEGKPDTNAAEVVEVLDLYNIVRTASAGDMKNARRLFAARSQWVAASFGATVEVNRRLRAGASPDELFGGLTDGPEAMWKKRADDDLAKVNASDKDNKTLFGMFPGALKAGDYEAVAKNVWKTEKSPWILKSKKPDPDSDGSELMFSYGSNVMVMPQAYALHAALLAKARGQKGFVILPIFTQNIFAASIKTGNPGDPGLAAPIFNDAEEVIAALSPLMPDPVTLKARQAAKTSR